MPAEIYRVRSIDRGFIAIMPHPARDEGAAATLSELAGLGVRLVVSLLEPAEAAMLGLGAEAEQSAEQGMDFISFPVPDMGIPSSAGEFAQLSKLLFTRVGEGVNTLVHCRGGIGRSGLLAAAVLLHCGLDPEQACAEVSRKRGMRVPETRAQRDWLASNHGTIVSNGNEP